MLTIIPPPKKQSLQLGIGSTESQNVPVSVGNLLAGETVEDIAAGFFFTVVMIQDGTVFAFGCNSEGQLGLAGVELSSVPMQVRTPSANQVSFVDVTALQVAAGGYHVLAMLREEECPLGFSGTPIEGCECEQSCVAPWRKEACGWHLSLVLCLVLR